MKKKLLSYIGAVVLFLVLAYAFVPQVLGGKIVNQSDISGYQGMAQEMNVWNSQHPDDPAAWTGSMFSGMPTTIISAPRQGDLIQPIYDFLLTGKRPATYLFISLLGAFLLMLSLGVKGVLAVGGAIAVSFCSYNMQIIQVGHNTKMQALAFLPWALAAVIFTYRSINGEKYFKRSLLGAVLFAFALSFQIKANHTQITYYLAILIFLYAIAEFIWILADKSRRRLLKRFFAVSALLLVIGSAGIATNANKLIPIYKYTPYSMRGGSELATEGNGSDGLEIDYATAWSYGWDELPNLLVPNFNGGSSAGAVNPDKSATIQLLKSAGQGNLKETAKALPLYWGPQPFTAGPMYMGAITVFLFILGLCLCEGKDKWWLLVSTILAILLGLGSNFIGFTKLWYDYAPMYNKFRTVSMALTMLQFTLPMLGFVALQKILDGGVDKVVFKKKGLIAYAVTGGFCLLVWLFPGIAGSFSGGSDASMQEVLVDALVSDRIMLLRSDALRSFLMISATFILILWGFSVPNTAKETFSSHPEFALGRRTLAALLVCFLILVDLFAVGKRYLNSDDFITPKAFNGQFDKRTVDELILADEEPSYRVLDLTVSPFNDSHPSYWHKNIGGYSPAKLQRYQDIIDNYLTSEINSIYSAASGASTIQQVQDSLPYLPALSALNCKYIIFGPDNAPVQNPYAFGPAWFVDSLPQPGSAQEKLISLARVAEDRYEGDDFIELTEYSPNELTYHYEAAEARTAVFSEVYYPEGWKAYLDDGSVLDLKDAYWILRSAELPAGDHVLVLRFDPEYNHTAVALSRASSILLLLLLIGTCVWKFVPKKL